MLRSLLVPLGILLVVAAAVDELWTTMWVGIGVGPLSRRFTGSAWHFVLRRASHHKRHTFLRRAGFTIVLGAVAMWFVLLWLGWWLVFLGAEGAVTDTAGRPAGTLDRFYFAGYSLVTLGNGEFRPGGPGWQFATVSSSASGLFFVSLAITYLVPVVSAVAHKRQLGASIFALGRSAEEVVAGAWTGRDFDGFERYLASVGPDLGSLAQQHVSYPILYFFHSEDRRVASGPGVAVLDEALTILEFGILTPYRPSPLTMRWTRAAIDAYLGTLHAAFMGPGDRSPPPPGLDRLRRAGLPVVSDDVFHAAVSALTERRRTLLGLVESEGWTWADVQPDAEPEGSAAQEGDPGRRPR